MNVPKGPAAPTARVPNMLPWGLLQTLIAGCLALLTAGCAGGPIGRAEALNLDEVPGAIQRASAQDVTSLDDRAVAKVVASMISVIETPEISTDDRATARAILERSAEHLAVNSSNPEDLEDLALSDLPARIAVPAGLRGARQLLEEDERSDAFRLIQRMDERYPSHALRDEAGQILWDIGVSYAEDTRRRLFLFPYSNRAPAVFEYLSTEYPTHPTTDDALTRLAEIYTEGRLFDLAIEKHRDLVLWASASPYRIAAEAAIPRLRLEDLDGPEYDRDAMLLAESELLDWIRDHGSHELRPEVDRTLIDCLQRLADNDLGVARFYATVKSPEGARVHAERALEYGKRAGNGEQIAEIREFLVSVDEIEVVDAPVILQDSRGPEFEGDAGLGISSPSGLSPSLPTAPKRPEDRTDEEPDEDPETPGDGADGPGGKTP